MRRNLDLWLILALAGTGLAVQWLTVTATMRTASGLALVVLCPGYALTMALFPERLPGWPERILFSLGLSLATAILGAVAVNLLPWGLQTGVWAGLFAAVTLGASLAAAWRRRGQPDEVPARLPQRNLGWSQWSLLGLAVLLTAGAVELVRTPLPTTGVLGYTLLWITPAGDASWPDVHLAMSSSELTTTHYRLRVTLDSQLYLDVPDITLEPGGKWERQIALSGGQPVRVVEAVLYRQAEPGTVYRRVALFRSLPES